MDTFACNLIATFGGSTAVSRFTAAPVSTVHSWKHNGIPQSRLEHLRLIAEKESIAVDWDSGLPDGQQEPESPSDDDAPGAAPVSATKSGQNIRGMEGGRGHPFHPSSPISSETRGRRRPSAASPASSAGDLA